MNKGEKKWYLLENKKDATELNIHIGWHQLSISAIRHFDNETYVTKRRPKNTYVRTLSFTVNSNISQTPPFLISPHSINFFYLTTFHQFLKGSAFSDWLKDRGLRRSNSVRMPTLLQQTFHFFSICGAINHWLKARRLSQSNSFWMSLALTNISFLFKRWSYQRLA